jgi:uncharacterized OB-fold protein
MPSPRYWREKPSRFRLEAGRCKGCGKVVFPKRKICPACRGREWEEIQLERRGKVVTNTVVQVPPDDFLMEAPYVMAIIESPEGARFMAQVVDCDPADVKPGTEVELEFRLIRREGHSGILCYGHKGVPVA